jgi:hypothetical protein
MKIRSVYYLLLSTLMTFPLISKASSDDQLSYLNPIQTSIEKELGQNLSQNQIDNLNQQIDGYYQQPSIMIQAANSSMERMALFCLGGSVHVYIVSGQAAICSTFSGKIYYMKLVGLGPSGRKLALGGEAFTFLVNKDSAEPLRPNFKGLQFRGIKELKSFDKYIGKFGVVGPRGGLFHSILGNQGAILAGLRLGKIDALEFSDIDIYESFSEMMEDIRNPKSPKDRWEILVKKYQTQL